MNKILSLLLALTLLYGTVPSNHENSEESEITSQNTSVSNTNSDTGSDIDIFDGLYPLPLDSMKYFNDNDTIFKSDKKGAPKEDLWTLNLQWFDTDESTPAGAVMANNGAVLPMYMKFSDLNTSFDVYDIFSYNDYHSKIRIIPEYVLDEVATENRKKAYNDEGIFDESLYPIYKIISLQFYDEEGKNLGIESVDDLKEWLSQQNTEDLKVDSEVYKKMEEASVISSDDSTIKASDIVNKELYNVGDKGIAIENDLEKPVLVTWFTSSDEQEMILFPKNLSGMNDTVFIGFDKTSEREIPEKLEDAIYFSVSLDSDKIEEYKKSIIKDAVKVSELSFKPYKVNKNESEGYISFCNLYNDSDKNITVYYNAVIDGESKRGSYTMSPYEIVSVSGYIYKELYIKE